jgi:hypothetical protein
VYKDVEGFDLDVLECYALVRLFPAPVVCGSEVIGMMADDVLVDEVPLLLGADEDLTISPLAAVLFVWLVTGTKPISHTHNTYPNTGAT